MKYFLLVLSTIFFLSCSSNNNEQKLKIAVNSWIGYAPLFYAQEKGYLKELNIKLVPTVSLGESANIFSVAKVDMLTATQHELKSLKKTFPTLEPIILIDRSNGGDMILSNKTIQELQESKKIYVYLEIDSINSEMIQTFTKEQHLDPNKMIYIDQDQSQMQDIKFTSSKDILIVTYTPYDTTLEHTGFRELDSTKNIKNLLVVDAICASKDTVDTNKKRLQKLKSIIDKSIEEINTNPKEAHRLTAGYLNNINFEEYQNSMKMIKWINRPSDKLLIELKKIHYLKENLI